MTTPTAHQAIAVAVSALDNHSTVLNPQTGTPLAALMNVPGYFDWSYDHIASLPEDEQVDALAQMVADESVEDLATNVDIHNGQIVSDIAAAVTTHIAYYRNTVTPVVKEFQNLVQEVLETPESLVNQFNVVIKDMPEVMQNDSFRSEVEKHAGGSALEPERHVNIPCEGPEFVLKNLQTGSASEDKTIAAWAAGIGDEGLVSLWDFFYGKGSGSIVQRMGGRDGLDPALFAYLSARRMYDDVPDGVNLTLVEFRRYIGQYRDCAANQLRNLYGREDTLAKTNIVVSSYNSITREVRVNGATYRQYLEQGGKNEVIFGSMYAGAQAQTIGDLLGKTDEYYSAYQRQEAMVAATRRLKSAAIFRGALKEVFVKMLGSITEDEQTAMNTFGLTIENFMSNVSDQIACLSESEMKDVNGACLKVMTRTRFSYTDAEKFLTSMNEAELANPGLDPREVAHIATIELVADYVSDQIFATRIR